MCLRVRVFMCVCVCGWVHVCGCFVVVGANLQCEQKCKRSVQHDIVQSLLQLLQMLFYLRHI
jgi:hypothetical protein